MSVVETDTVTAEQSSIDESKSSAPQVLAAIAFFGTVSIAMLGWIAFLIWIVLALIGF
jgi:hypothetical protein